MEYVGVLVTIIVVGIIGAGVLRHRKRKARSGGTGGGGSTPPRVDEPATEDQVER